MKISDILKETPLPDSWDTTEISDDKSFSSKIRYALERAERIGTGSARIAFEIEYEGRPTILKIAKNKKGLAQNQYEAEILSDGYIQLTKLFIPIIDHDLENYEANWIHTEKADKITQAEFKKHFSGLSSKKLYYYLAFRLQQLDPNNHERPNNNYEVSRGEEFVDVVEGNDAISDLVDVFRSYSNMMYGDIVTLSNWGMYENRPVIIDVGLNVAIFDLHYRKR